MGWVQPATSCGRASRASRGAPAARRSRPRALHHRSCPRQARCPQRRCPHPPPLMPAATQAGAQARPPGAPPPVRQPCQQLLTLQRQPALAARQRQQQVAGPALQPARPPPGCPLLKQLARQRRAWRGGEQALHPPALLLGCGLRPLQAAPAAPPPAAPRAAAGAWSCWWPPGSGAPLPHAGSPTARSRRPHQPMQTGQLLAPPAGCWARWAGSRTAG